MAGPHGKLRYVLNGANNAQDREALEDKPIVFFVLVPTEIHLKYEDADLPEIRSPTPG
jgi:hypothetical protein